MGEMADYLIDGVYDPFNDTWEDEYTNRSLNWCESYPFEKKREKKPKTYLETYVFKGAIVGVSFHPCPANLQTLYKRSLYPDIVLHHTPVEQDKYAVAVTNERDHMLGWIPKTVNKDLLAIGLDKLKATFERYNIYDDKAVGMTILVERKT